ncbi:MAG: hypothetical protein K2W82_08735 [Candidatus Obscuribacterales bacterium]|nr:hypothetical protein [Candidatus Obscuribacterales bacterium]
MITRASLPTLFWLIGVFVLSVTAFSVHVFLLGLPNMTLLFDSQAYLWVAASLQNFCQAENLSKLIHYCAAGFAESERLQLLASVPNLAEICKTGPVVTGYLACAYTLAVKEIGSQNWSVAATSMILMSAGSVTGIWLLARLVADLKTACLATFLSLVYAGLTINAGRPLSELPLINLTVWFAVMLSWYLFKEWNAMTSALSNKTRFGAGILLGVLLSLLLLARPTVILLPFLLLPLIFFTTKIGKQKHVFHKATLGGFLLALFVTLAPWVLCKQICTGTPSITVDRYGAWNIFAGTNLSSDGWDMLPSENVSHPDRFKLSMSEAFKQTMAEAGNHPAAFIYLLLRKPARLIDSPWNDFQLPVWGMTFPAQRFLHQIILLAALFGFFKLFEQGWQRRDSSRLFSAGILGILVVYQFVSCVFITMSRYFAAAIPSLMILAACGFIYARHQPNLWRRATLIVAMILPPAAAFILEQLYAKSSWQFTSFACDIGPELLALVSSLVISGLIVLSIWLFMLSLKQKSLGPWLLAIGAVSTVCCFASCWDRFSSMEGVVKSTDNQNQLKTMYVDLPSEMAQKQLIMVIDVDTAEGMTTEINGRLCKLNFLPLWSIDSSSRENLTYGAAFAYSSNRSFLNFRQWRAALIPAEIMKTGERNTVKFPVCSKLFADFVDEHNKCNHELSVREFSWSKGFFANSPGEMRANVWPGKPDFKSEWLRPRAFLLALDKESAALPQEMIELSLPNQQVGLAAAERMKVVPLSYKLSKASCPATLHIKVSGTCRSTAGQGIGSVALIETWADGKETFAPLAPQKIQVDGQGQKFSFDELLPLPAGAKPPTLRLLFLARPWWEALSYASYKGKVPVEFSVLKVRLNFEPQINLNSKSDVYLLHMER